LPFNSKIHKLTLLALYQVVRLIVRMYQSCVTPSAEHDPYRPAFNFRGLGTPHWAGVKISRHKVSYDQKGSPVRVLRYWSRLSESTVFPISDGTNF
jgi:hypothetical protein